MSRFLRPGRLPSARLALFAGLALAGLGLLLPRPSAAQEPSGEQPAAAATAEDPIEAGLIAPEEVSAIARELNCPLCQGYNLQDCPLTVCAQMRMLIAQQLAEGQSPEQIRAGFVADYGPQVLNAPPTEGAWLAAWVLPGLLLLVGAIWLGRRWSRREDRTPAAAPSRASASPTGAPSSGADQPETGYTRRFEDLSREEDR